MPQNVYGHQRTTFGCWFSPSICGFWGLNLGPQALGQGLYPLSHLVGSMVLVLNGSSYFDVDNHVS